MRVCLCNLDCMRSNFASLSYSRSAACSLRHQNSLRLDVEPMAWMGRGAELIAGGFRSVQSRSGPSRQRSPAVRTLAISKPSVLISPTYSAKLTDLPPYETMSTHLSAHPAPGGDSCYPGACRPQERSSAGSSRAEFALTLASMRGEMPEAGAIKLRSALRLTLIYRA